jgi:hypothetical protein
MNLMFIIFLSVAGLLALILVLAFFMKKEHFVRREIVINAPRQKVFDYIKLLKNQDEFNKHAMTGPDRKKEFKGTDGTIGYIYAWSGSRDAGVGEKEIINIVDGKKIETEIRFVKPMIATASIIMETESVSEDVTRVNWSNAGSLKYPVNIFIPMMEKSVAKDMDISLSTLKKILENN